uniref:Uncharacterized protein n=1 Tax=Chromera velia CCMP2878 TaxID=1169474 RepID=A0A0G4I9K5_9ALVE|eukprot:Cvel_12305.t1-p1 / transcript=Cvel_12305.t1 / gene=Cvel_12305 / organism=Chromera_velia_CCMP2878 / gene_product=hypothetical protein / transcript_product=hypothetical protein / location=Cvel_scaffold799:29106-32217(-) / protein_length=856 / sequence_SO=supercontig / SO=protein_coding / is_pseudo=false
MEKEDCKDVYRGLCEEEQEFHNRLCRDFAPGAQRGTAIRHSFEILKGVVRPKSRSSTKKKLRKEVKRLCKNAQELISKYSPLQEGQFRFLNAEFRRWMVVAHQRKGAERQATQRKFWRGLRAFALMNKPGGIVKCLNLGGVVEVNGFSPGGDVRSIKQRVVIGVREKEDGDPGSPEHFLEIVYVRYSDGTVNFRDCFGEKFFLSGTEEGTGGDLVYRVCGQFPTPRDDDWEFRNCRDAEVLPAPGESLVRTSALPLAVTTLRNLNNRGGFPVSFGSLQSSDRSEGLIALCEHFGKCGSNSSFPDKSSIVSSFAYLAGAGKEFFKSRPDSHRDLKKPVNMERGQVEQLGNVVERWQTLLRLQRTPSSEAELADLVAQFGRAVRLPDSESDGISNVAGVERYGGKGAMNVLSDKEAEEELDTETRDGVADVEEVTSDTIGDLLGEEYREELSQFEKVWAGLFFMPPYTDSNVKGSLSLFPLIQSSRVESSLRFVGVGKQVVRLCHQVLEGVIEVEGTFEPPFSAQMEQVLIGLRTERWEDFSQPPSFSEAFGEGFIESLPTDEQEAWRQDFVDGTWGLNHFLQSFKCVYLQFSDGRRMSKNYGDEFEGCKFLGVHLAEDRRKFEVYLFDEVCLLFDSPGFPVVASAPVTSIPMLSSVRLPDAQRNRTSANAEKPLPPPTPPPSAQKEKKQKPSIPAQKPLPPPTPPPSAQKEKRQKPSIPAQKPLPPPTPPPSAQKEKKQKPSIPAQKPLPPPTQSVLGREPSFGARAAVRLYVSLQAVVENKHVSSGDLDRLSNQILSTPAFCDKRLFRHVVDQCVRTVSPHHPSLSSVLRNIIGRRRVRSGETVSELVQEYLSDVS